LRNNATRHESVTILSMPRSLHLPCCLLSSAQEPSHPWHRECTTRYVRRSQRGGYNIVAIPLAVSVLAPFGIELQPAVNGILMIVSTTINDNSYEEGSYSWCYRTGALEVDLRYRCAPCL